MEKNLDVLKGWFNIFGKGTQKEALAKDATDNKNSVHNAIKEELKKILKENGNGLEMQLDTQKGCFASIYLDGLQHDEFQEVLYGDKCSGIKVSGVFRLKNGKEANHCYIEDLDIDTQKKILAESKSVLDFKKDLYALVKRNGGSITFKDAFSFKYPFTPGASIKRIDINPDSGSLTFRGWQGEPVSDPYFELEPHLSSFERNRLIETVENVISSGKHQTFSERVLHDNFEDLMKESEEKEQANNIKRR